MIEVGSELSAIGDFCFESCCLEMIEIPRSVEIIGRSSFARANIEALLFETSSELKLVKEFCFEKVRMRSICLPRQIETIDRLAFVGSQIDNILIEGTNHVITFQDNFLVDMNEKKALRYFGADSNVIICRDIENIGSLCFSGYENNFTEY
jgi:hypothetical protein